MRYGEDAYINIRTKLTRVWVGPEIYLYCVYPKIPEPGTVVISSEREHEMVTVSTLHHVEALNFKVCPKGADCVDYVRAYRVLHHAFSILTACRLNRSAMSGSVA